MVTQEKIAEFSGETVRNVAGTLIWLARPPEQSEVLSRNWLVHLPKNQDRDEFQELRWTIMINDELLAPSIGVTYTNGAGFMASMENL